MAIRQPCRSSELVQQWWLGYYFAAMESQDLARGYETKADEELLRLALDSVDLTPEANAALNVELSKRRLNQPERLEAFRQGEWKRKEDLQKDSGKLWVIHQYGIGRK